MCFNEQSKCKVRHEIVNINSNETLFYPFVLKQVNVVVVLTISMILMQKYVFLMFLKIQISMFLI